MSVCMGVSLHIPKWESMHLLSNSIDLTADFYNAVLQMSPYVTHLGDGDPRWVYTLKFEHGNGLDFCTMHLSTKFHHPMFNRSEVIVLTKKQTHNVTLLKTSTALHYAMPVKKNHMAERLNYTKFFSAWFLWLWLSHSLAALWYIMNFWTFGFVSDVTFLHNGPYGT